MLYNHFKILITVYNSENYIEQCIKSALLQKYNDFEVVIIDDCSTDSTWDIISKYECTKYRRDERQRDSLINTIWYMNTFPGDRNDVIIHLDGDDYLAGDFVLEYLNNVYTDDIWMTYGQYEPVSHKYHDYCQPIPNTRTYRRSGLWVTSHLKTWRRWLWHRIKDEDFRDKNGNYLTASSDRAFIYPMIEMSGKEHIKFIDKVLYYYNDMNPSCCMYHMPKVLSDTATYLILKPSYKEL